MPNATNDKVTTIEPFDPLTDTGKVARAIQQVKDELKKEIAGVVRDTIREERHTAYKAISKVISNILGILKDPEL